MGPRKSRRGPRKTPRRPSVSFGWVRGKVSAQQVSPYNRAGKRPPKWVEMEGLAEKSRYKRAETLLFRGPLQNLFLHATHRPISELINYSVS